MVDLREFVRQTILDVLNGIADAQKDPEVGNRVAPKIVGNTKVDPSFGVASHDRSMWSVMKFDVAITAQTAKEGGGGAKASAKANIHVVAFEGSLGGDAKLTNKNETVSRIQFPIHFRLDQG
jgi:hypothetical protein